MQVHESSAGHAKWMFSVLECLLSKGGNNGRALFFSLTRYKFSLYLNMVHFLTPHVSQPNW